MDMMYKGTNPQRACAYLANYLLEHPFAWTTGVGARDVDGMVCNPSSPEARKWCLMGLMERFVVDEATRRDVLQLVARAVASHVGQRRSVPMFNDAVSTCLSDVVDVLIDAVRITPTPDFDYERYIRDYYSVACAQFEYIFTGPFSFFASLDDDDEPGSAPPCVASVETAVLAA